MEAITREEKLLSGQQLEPITRKELFLAKAAGMDVQTPEPITREEIFLSQISGGGGGAEPAVIEPLSVTANGTYNPPDGVDGYSPVTVSVARDDQTDIEEQFIRAIERDYSKPVTELPEGLTKIGNYAFETCENLAITELPTSITSIGDYAFKNCVNMTLDSLPAGITNIGIGAFNSCSKITITSIPEGVTKINKGAFGNCHGIQEFTFPAGVKSVDNYSLSSTKLSAVTFKGKPTTIGRSAFYGCSNPLTINVPWAEGEVANAPWDATNATINYNYTGG